MRVLYLSDPYFADCDFPLVKALKEKNIDITYMIVLSPYNLKSTLFSIKNQYDQNDIIPASYYPEIMEYKNYMNLNNVFIANCISSKDSSYLSLSMTFKIIKFIKKEKFDVIHIDRMLSMWNLILYFLFGNKILLTVHDPFPHSGEKSLRKKLNYKIAMYFTKFFVLLNKAQKQIFCDFYKISSDRVFINNLGVYDNIRTYAKDSITRKINNVLFFGRISPYKGVEYLCKAMKKVREVIPNATLTIAGGGKLYFDIREYKNYDWIDIRNRYIDMPELAELLQQCSLSVCPYIDATQSGVIMTSYSMCVPVIATDVGGLSEMVDNNKSGILVKPKDIESLASSIIKMLNEPRLLDNMRQYIMNEYFNGEKSWANISINYIDIYNRYL